MNDRVDRAALRAELFAQFFLPPPGQVVDPSLLSRLSVPVDPARWRAPDPESARIARARVRVARFRPVNHPQRQLRCLVLEMLDYMARELLGPGCEQALEEWWSAARAYARVLALPVMATPRARTLLPLIIDARWGEVEEAAATLCDLATREAPNHYPPGRTGYAPCSRSRSKEQR